MKAQAILALAVTCWAIGAGAADVIAIKPETDVKGPKLLLGDLASIEGEHMEELAAIEMGFAALPGESKSLQAALIQARLERAGYPPEALEVTGAKMVRVTTRHLEVSSEAVKESLRDFIEVEMPWDPEATTIDLIVPTFNVVVPEGDVTFRWWPSPGYRYLGRGAFRGEILVDGVPRKSIVCRSAIEPYGPVVVAINSISRGQSIGVGDVALEQWALSAAGRDAFTDVGEVVGLVARKTISPDQVITKGHVAQRKLLKRNQIVTVETYAGSLVVRIRARALADGCAGDFVPCMNLDSAGEFFGVVRQDGVVVVK